MLMFFLLLALVFSVIGSRRTNGGLDFGWSVAVGLTTGLAISSKLAALIGLMSILAWSTVAAMLALGMASEQSWRSRITAAWRVSKGWLLAVGIAIHVLLISDPYLYPDPGVNTLKLFSQLAFENTLVQTQFPNGVLKPLDRPRYVMEGSLVDHTLTAGWGLPIEPFLAALGAGGMLLQVWLSWRRERIIRARGLLLITVMTYYLCISMSISMAWQRYLVPTTILSAVFSGVGVTWIIHTVTGIVAALVGSIYRLVRLGPRIQRA
jgi:hypothetical protein